MHTTLTPDTDPRDGIGVAGWSEQSQFQIEAFPAESDARKQGLKPGDGLGGANGGTAARDGVELRGRPSAHRVRPINGPRELPGPSGGKPVEIVYERKGEVKT